MALLNLGGYEEVIMVEGNCEHCHMSTQLFNAHQRRMICDGCYEKYYSESAIRDKKIEGILKESLYRRILNKFKQI